MAPSTDPFGLLAFLHWNHAWNNYHFNEQILTKAVRQLKTLGISMIRMDILWADIHKGHLLYDYSRYDRLIRLVREQGIEILALLHYNKLDREGETILWNRPPDSFDEFASYVQSTVARYKSDIHHWEIWNEPNHPTYWAGPKDSLRLYSVLLEKSYLAAKLADPACLILNGGLAEPVLTDVENLYRNGSQPFFDRLNIHLFPDPNSPLAADHFHETVQGVRSLMKKYGDEAKFLWITELGCPGLPFEKKELKWFGGNSVSEETQGAWIEDAYSFLKTKRFIEKMFWAFYRDTGDMFHDATDYLGIVHHDLTPKPAFLRFQKLIQNYHSTLTLHD